MGISIKHTILFLVVMSSVFIYLPHAKGGCGGACAISSGGSSYDFLGDPSVNIDMSSFDEFVRDNLGNNQTTFQVKSLSQDKPLNANPSLNQTSNGNSSQNSSEVRPVINSSLGNTTSDNRIVKLGASSMQDKRLSTLAFTNFNNRGFRKSFH